ncbi:MAG TPA: hypothetical protein VJH22_00690 [Candidatus Nanoarchaeia archaeon]|nr:hypothetical protein [Candidatus Nanoarchaeia archaeon]
MTKISQILSKKEKKELIPIIEKFIYKYPELESSIRIEKREIIPKIKNLFSHFWDWNQVKVLILQLEIILDGVKTNKKSWDKELLRELEISADIMIRNMDNVHGEDEIALFLEDWFETIGEVFIRTKPSISEKKEFINKIYKLIDKDDYGLSESFEKALAIISKTKRDLELIKEIIRPLESK